MPIDALIVSAYKGEEGYVASFKLSYKDKEYSFRVERLSRKPLTAQTELRGEYVLVRFIDERGEGIATCQIHVEHLEKGCIECRCLMLPPGSGT